MRTFTLIATVLFGFHLFLATRLPIVDDELYYWCWSQDLQLSYYDHPPMSAYMIRLSTLLFGDTVLGVRFPAVFSTWCVLLLIGSITRPQSLLLYVIFTPLYFLGAVLVTPDTPLLLFWAAYVVWLVHAQDRYDRDRRLSWGFWTIGGLLLGCGALGKYTTALLVPSSFLVWLLADARGMMRWLPGYIYHGAISFLVFLPVVIFNIQKDFAPIRYQWEHAMATEESGYQPFFEFLGVQILLFGTLPLILLPWAWWNLRSLAQVPQLRVAVCAYALPLTFFIYKSLRGPLEGNWALAAFLSFWPLAAHWYEGVRNRRLWRVFVALTFGFPLGAVLLVSIHLLTPIEVNNPFSKEPGKKLLPPEQDRISRQYVILNAIEQAAETIRRDGKPLPVYAASYQMTAMLRFHKIDARQIDGVTRPSHFTFRKVEHLTDSDHAYVFHEGPLPQEFTVGFENPKLIARFPIVVRGKPYTELQLLEYHKK